jgi:DNA-binding transcriptional regulator YiaG
MPKKTLPRILAVLADQKQFVLYVEWNNGSENRIDISNIINTFRVYTPLRHSHELFQKAQLGEYGTDIVWQGNWDKDGVDEIDISAQTLWRLCQEQTGMTMSPDGFKTWRENKSYTLDAAATALGLSRRMVAYYEQGAKPIPRIVALATRGLEQPSLFER